jgi:hypothetical protein
MKGQLTMWKNVEETLGTSLERVLTGLAAFLPSLLAMLLALLLSTLLAWMIRIALRRMLNGIKFDARLERWGFTGLAEFSPGRSPTRLVCRVATWIVLLFGLLLGLLAVEDTLMARLFIRLFEYLPSILVALAVLFFGSLLARFLARSVLVGAVNLQMQSARLISQVTKWLLLIVTYAMALDHLRVGGDIVKIAFALLFGGVVLALALAIGFGARGVVSRALETQSKESPPPDDDAAKHV